jgi:hypothetical protein
MDQSRPKAPLQALPVAPQQALPVAPQQALPVALREAQGMIALLHATLLQKEAELVEAKETVLVVLQHYGAERADRTAHARRAGSTPKQKIARKRDEMVEEWLAESYHWTQRGVRVVKGQIDKTVAERLGVDPARVKRARLRAGV